MCSENFTWACAKKSLHFRFMDLGHFYLTRGYKPLEKQAISRILELRIEQRLPESEMHKM